MTNPTSAIEKFKMMRKEKSKKTPEKKVKDAEVEEVSDAEVEEVKDEPKKKSTRKKSTKKKEEKTKDDDEDGKGLMVYGNKSVSTNVGSDIKLPSAMDIISSGKVVAFGRPDIIADVINGFLPITFMKLAQAINLPEYAGKFVSGKDDNVTMIDTDMAFLLLLTHMHERPNYNDPSKYDKVMSLYFYAPEADRVYVLTLGSTALDIARDVAANGVAFYNLGAKLITKEFKNDSGKLKKSKYYQPTFEEVDDDIELDESKLEKAIGIIEKNLSRFIAKNPDQHPDFDISDNDISDVDEDEMPF